MHTHFDTALGDSVTADDYESGSRAAAFGGVTTFVNYAFQGDGESVRQAIDREAAKAAPKSYVDYSNYKTRSYRVSGQRIETTLGVKAMVGVKESVEHMVRMIQHANQVDFLNPRYYNIAWLKSLLELEARLKRAGGSVL